MAATYIRICAILIGLRSLTNFGKLTNDDAVIVFFGAILRGGEVILPSVAVGVYMLATAVAMLLSARIALPLLVAYAAYVLINMAAWSFWQSHEFVRVGGMLSSATDPNTLWWWGIVGMIGYAAVAIATTALPAWLLWQQRSSARG